MPSRSLISQRGAPLLLVVAATLAACAQSPPPSSPGTAAPPVSSSAGPSATSSVEPSLGVVEPAPGSDSVIYEPNPRAIVVAIDAGHGGCLDWGVPDPTDRGVQWSEKTMTLAIAQRLRDRLEADGIGVLMIRDSDEALAGDQAPDFGCLGPPWRDVDGDGQAGFEDTGRIRTRDELQARIDLANLARADVFVSIHINSLTQDGVTFDIAATQTFYDDESAWGASSGALAEELQSGVVRAISPLADYDRQDRGTDAVAYYVISREWRDGDTCETPGDEWCKPHRALAMPGALSEVGSINLRPEHDLLGSPAGQQAIADGMFEGLAAYLGSRELAGRIGLEDEDPGTRAVVQPGSGPPFSGPAVESRTVRLRLTNTGTARWPAGLQLMGAAQASDLPYLPEPPADLAPLADPLPALQPGESTVVEATLPPAQAGRSLAWIGIQSGDRLLTDVGWPPLQLVITGH